MRHAQTGSELHQEFHHSGEISQHSDRPGLNFFFDASVEVFDWIGHDGKVSINANFLQVFAVFQKCQAMDLSAVERTFACEVGSRIYPSPAGYALT